MEYKIGDEVTYSYSKGIYKVINRFTDAWGSTRYTIQKGEGMELEAFEIELTLHLPEGKPIQLSNGCTCGAWISSWPEDHMHFCDKFKGVK